MSERIAIVGAGVMGENHARTLAEIEGVRLTHMIDPDRDRAQRLARAYGDHDTIVSSDLAGVDGYAADAAIIASPSRFHEAQAVQLINSGLGVLIEKPVAETPSSALIIDEAARRMGSTAMVGHIELFNPTVNSLIKLVEDEGLREMSFDRLGKVSDVSRLYHDSVSDLMIHDLAIALRILDLRGHTAEGLVLSAIGRSETSAAPDPARASIRFDEVDAHFRASRVHPAGKVRRAVIETDDKIFTADLLNRTIRAQSANDLSLTPEGVIIEDTHSTHYFPRDSKQPLALEQTFFLDALRGRVDPSEAGVSIPQAIRALKYTRKILDLIRNTPEHSSSSSDAV